MTLGDHVRFRRSELRLTQAEAAYRLGITRDALARWEGTDREPEPRLIPAVIRFLGYNPLPPADTFAQRLRRGRRTLGLRQPDFAAALGVPAGTLHAWEKALYEPGKARESQVLNRLARLLNDQSAKLLSR